MKTSRRLHTEYNYLYYDYMNIKYRVKALPVNPINIELKVNFKQD